MKVAHWVAGSPRVRFLLTSEKGKTLWAGPLHEEGGRDGSSKCEHSLFPLMCHVWSAQQATSKMGSRGPKETNDALKP